MMQREVEYFLEDAEYFHLPLAVARLRTGASPSSVLYAQRRLMRGFFSSFSKR